MNSEINKGVPKECQEMHAIDQDNIVQPMEKVKGVKQDEFDQELNNLRGEIKTKEKFTLQETQKELDEKYELIKDLERKDRLNRIATLLAFAEKMLEPTEKSKQQSVEV